MKKMIAMLCVAALVCSLTVVAFASGGKHHGDKGKGTVKQVQVNK